MPPPLGGQSLSHWTTREVPISIHLFLSMPSVNFYSCVFSMMTVIYEWASQVVLVVKTLPASAEDTRDAGSVPGWGRSTGGGKWHLLQYSCLKNYMDRSPVGCSPWSCRESNVTEQLNTHSLTHTHPHTRVNLSQHSINSIGNY